MPLRLCSKNSDQLPVLNRLTDILTVGKFDHSVVVQYQNLTRKLNSSGPLEPRPQYDVPPETPSCWNCPRDTCHITTTVTKN